MAAPTSIHIANSPGLPPFTSSTIDSGGFLVFDRGLPLINCPAPNLNSLPADFLPWWAEEAAHERQTEAEARSLRF